MRRLQDRHQGGDGDPIFTAADDHTEDPAPRTFAAPAINHRTGREEVNHKADTEAGQLWTPVGTTSAQIASDKYWDKPEAPADEPSRGAVYKAMMWGGAAQGAIDREYEDMKLYGVVEYLTFPEGAAFGLPESRGFLKVIQDSRTEPKRGADWEPGDSELFDAQAQEMVDEILYDGKDASLRTDGPRGPVEIGRRVLYLRPSASRDLLAGKRSDLLGRGGNQLTTELVPYGRVGEKTTYETRRTIVQSRIIGASVLRAGGARSERVRVDPQRPVRDLFENIWPRPGLTPSFL